MPGRLSRRAIAQYVSDGLIKGDDKAQLLDQLAGFLVENRRIKELELIVRDIEWNLSEKGYVQATVTSAFDLSAEASKTLEAFIQHKTTATQVSLDTNIDSTVLGGVKITLPGRELDQTVAHQLTVLKTRFKKA